MFDDFISKLDFNKSSYDSCAFINSNSYSSKVYLLLYADDMLLAGKSKIDTKKVKIALKEEFDMKKLGESKRILGIDITRERTKRILTIDQSNYCYKVLKMFIMLDAKQQVVIPLSQHFKLSATNCPNPEDPNHVKYMANIPYSQVIESIMYLMIPTRPDLSYSSSLISRYMANPRKRHWKTAKWVLRYLKRSMNAKLIYNICLKELFEFYGFVDSDYAGDLNKRRSLTRYCFLIGVNLLSCKASLQPVVVLSSTEVEYIALSEAIKKSIWLKGLLKNFGLSQKSVKF